MAVVFKKYGLMVITGLIVLMMIVYMFYKVEYDDKKGVNEIAGSYYEKEGETYGDNADEKAMAEYIGKVKDEKPVLECISEQVVVNNPYSLYSLFKATDTEGNNIDNIIVTDIVSDYSDDLTAIYNESAKSLTFDKIGVYKVTVETYDKYSVKAEKQFVIFVNT